MPKPTTDVRPAKPLSGVDERLFAFMVERARFVDRVYFCSDDTAAAAIGVCRRTVIRARKRLEEAGRIVRVGEHRFGPRKITVKYGFPAGVTRLPVTQRFRRTTNRLSNPTLLLPSLRSGSKSFGFARSRFPYRDPIEREWRRLMQSRAQLTLVVCDDDVDVPPVATAQTVLARAVELARSAGIPVSSRARGMMARQLKELLADGFDEQCLIVACVEAIRQNMPMRLERIASAVALARVGEYQSQDAFRRSLEDTSELAARQKRPSIFERLRAEAEATA